MARELTETDNELNAASIGNGNTTTSITRPAFKFGKSKVGEANLPQERTVDDGVGFVGFEGFEPELQRERIQTQSEIKVSGKYPEVNYVAFNLPDINLVESISGNVYSGVIKRVFPVENLEPTDTSTSGTSGTSTTQGPTYPPFGQPGYVGEIREFPPTGQLYIWTVNYNVGRWRPYEEGQGGGASPTSGGVGDGGAAVLGDVGGGGFSGLGGGWGDVDPGGGPGGGKPGIIP